MLQPSTTTPGVSNSTGAAADPEYSGSSNFLAGEKEYTWCRILSLFGKLTLDPTYTGLTYGTNCLSTWSTMSDGGLALAMSRRSAGIARTTASTTGSPR